METKSLKIEIALNAWEALTELSKKANVPDFKASYAIARSYEKLSNALQPIFEEKNKIIKKYFELDETGKIKSLLGGMEKDEFNKEMKEFVDTQIEIEIYLIKLSSMKDITIANIEQQISLPPIYLIILKEWIEDDMEE